MDSYDVIFTAGEAEILSAFEKFDTKVVFSAEGFCWPDINLTDTYPAVESSAGNRFLNSGGFIGAASVLYEMIESGGEIENDADDQLFYTKIYLDQELRSKFGLKLDHKANMFQNLNGAVGDVELKFSIDDAYVENTAYRTRPLIVHGNGASNVSWS